MAKSNGYGRGDELVYLNIIKFLPQSLTEKQRQLMEELSKEFDAHVGGTRKGFKDKVRDFFDR